MNLILNLLATADKILQQRSNILVSGYDVINSTMTEIGKFKKRCRVWKNTAKTFTTVSPRSKQAQIVIFISVRRGRHNRTHRNSQWKWEFESILLWNHWYYSERIQPPVFGVYVSNQGRNQRKISKGQKSLLATIMTSSLCSQPWCDLFAMISLPTLVEETFSKRGGTSACQKIMEDVFH